MMKRLDSSCIMKAAGGAIEAQMATCLSTRPTPGADGPVAVSLSGAAKSGRAGAWLL
jgi:hypothetical protein